MIVHSGDRQMKKSMFAQNCILFVLIFLLPATAGFEQNKKDDTPKPSQSIPELQRQLENLHAILVDWGGLQEPPPARRAVYAAQPASCGAQLARFCLDFHACFERLSQSPRRVHVLFRRAIFYLAAVCVIYTGQFVGLVGGQEKLNPRIRSLVLDLRDLGALDRNYLPAGWGAIGIRTWR
jgi:hypothetical protein